MKLRFLATLAAALLCVSTGWTYSTPDTVAKTLTSDGSAADTLAAVAYVNSRAEDGWTLTIGEPGGEYAWTKEENYGMSFYVPYDFTVKGASPTNRPKITHGSSLGWQYAPGKLLVVKDLIFRCASNQQIYNSIQGSGPEPGFRFTNIKWEGNFNGQTVSVGSQGDHVGVTDEGPYGLFDNCTSDGVVSFNIYTNNGYTDPHRPSTSWRRPMEWGTAKAVYFEDCEFRYPDGTIGGTGLTDPFCGGSFVFRHNLVENIMIANHGADHFSNHVRSALKHEIYNNELHVTNGTAAFMIYLRGGTAAIFNNTFHASDDGGANAGIIWDYYRANAGSGPNNSIYDRFSGDLSTTIAAGSNGVDLAETFTVNVASTAGLIPEYPNYDLVGPVYNRIAAGSNGLSVTAGNDTVTGGTIHVNSTADFPSAGTLRIGTPPVPTTEFDPADVSTGQPYDYVEVYYTGKTATTFTGCTKNTYHAWTFATGQAVAGVGVGENSKWAIFIENIKITTSAGVQTVRATGRDETTFTGVTGGTGIMSTGGAVTRASDYFGTQQSGSGTITAEIAAGSNGATLPQATIHVDSTIAFPSSGRLLVNYNTSTGAGTEVTYTGKTGTTFTGCTGGTGTMATGQIVGGPGQDPRHPNEIWGSMPIWQWNNVAVASPTIGTPLTGKSVHDFIVTDQNIFIRDSQTTKPTATGTWLDEYTPLAYPHPLRAGDVAPDSVEATATTINAGTVTIESN